MALLIAVLLLTVFAWHSAQPKFAPRNAALFTCAVCLLVVIGVPLAASLPWHAVQPVIVAPHRAVPPKWQLMLAQLFVPLVQVKLLPLPAARVAVPFRWVVLPALIAVPVVVVAPWQLPHTAAPALSLACFAWLFARCWPVPALE